MRKLLALIGIAAAFVVGVAAQSSAGGWVAVSLDSMPTVHRGEDVEVGFTVLRHGVHPETNDGLAITLVGNDGTIHRFEAVPQGAVGHHVVTINVPERGTYEWFVRDTMGSDWAELGTLTVTDPPASASWRWDALQWGSATLALAMAGLAAFDFRRSRRGRAAPATA